MRQVAVVTGGSGGIGRALADRFALEGYSVYTLSRSGYAGSISAGGGIVTHIRTDVSDDRQVEAAFSRIFSAEGRIDVLICNAGTGISGAAEFTETADALPLFDVNFFGIHRCVRAVIPRMRENGGGKILLVSSAAAVFPIPFQSFYSASKSAVNALALALANELKSFGIAVCAVMPGDVKTGFTAARVKHHTGDDIYGGRIEGAVGTMERDEQNGMPPETVADEIFTIARRRRVKPLYTLGFNYKLLYFLQKILPIGLINRIIGRLYMK